MNRAVLIITSAAGLVTFAVVDPPRFRKYVIRPIQRTMGKVFTVIGFVANFAKDMSSSRSDSSKNAEWKKILADLNLYLEKAGLYDEFGTDVPKRLSRHVLVMNAIQHRHYSRMSSSSLRETTSVPSIQLAEHFMKFATAVYGPTVVLSAQLELGYINAIPSNADDISIEQAIANHTGINAKKDILVADVESGESMEYLRHMVVVDHSQRCVVLAVRGTISVTGALIDLAGFSDDFCGGHAHSGMAKMAKAVWKKASEEIQKESDDLPKDYDLVVTGHSLGAGVACLITILLYHERATNPDAKLPKNIRCMAYAPPPVFYPLTAAKEAVENTVAYVHNMDCVPSLSIHAVRRLLKTMNDLHIPLESIPLKETYPGMKLLPQLLVEVMAKSTLEPMPEKEGAEPLCVPAHSLIWLQLRAEDTEKNEDMDGCDKHEDTKLCYSTTVLDPLLYGERVIDVHSRMLADHMQPAYEKAFHYLVKAEAEKEDTI